MAVKLTREAYGEAPVTEFKNNLDAIKVELTDYQDFVHIMSYIPDFVRATYSQGPKANFTVQERLAIVRDVFMGRSLPTAQETIGMTFSIEGIDLTTVTHLIRHRQGSYSADCSAEKWWHLKDALVPYSIENSRRRCSKCGEGVMCGEENVPLGDSWACKNEFYARYCQIVEDAKRLYCDMVDSRRISIMDARSILPRCLSTYYFAHFPLNAAIAYMRQRVDRQIQPEQDNIIAYQMYLEILKVFPVANGIIDIDAQDRAYLLLKQKQGPMFKPEPKNDVWEHTDDEFLYPHLRSEMNGTRGGTYTRFGELYEKLSNSIRAQEEENNRILIDNYGLCISDLDRMEVPLR